MAAGEQRRSSPGQNRSTGQNRSNAAGDHPQRRGFSKPGRTQVERNRDLPVDRQIRILLKNPTPSPAEQNRLCELTRTKSYRAAVAVAKRMIAPGPLPVDPVPPVEPPARRRNPGNRPQG